MIKKIYKLFKPSYLSRRTNERMQYPRCTFLGDTMSQSFSSLFLWENVLSEVEFARFIELGTSSGTLSGYFYLFCLNKGAEFFTFDIKKDYNETKIKSVLNFDTCFKSHNVLDDPEFVREIINKDGRSILFCDNGNKPLEFELYAPHLKKEILFVLMTGMKK